jgi:hypothetical protein
MKIVDARKTTKHYEVVLFIDRALREIEPQLILGIRHVVLLDQDTYGKRDASGRYVSVAGTKWHDIEIYFKHFAEVPPDYAYPVYIAAMTVRTLLHEIYHHKLAFHHHARHPRFSAEQNDATRWAEDQLERIFPKVFEGEEYKQQCKELYTKWKSNQAL